MKKRDIIDIRIKLDSESRQRVFTLLLEEMSLGKFGRRFNISQPMMSDYKNGKYTIPMYIFKSILKIISKQESDFSYEILDANWGCKENGIGERNRQNARRSSDLLKRKWQEDIGYREYMQSEKHKQKISAGLRRYWENHIPSPKQFEAFENYRRLINSDTERGRVIRMKIQIGEIKGIKNALKRKFLSEKSEKMYNKNELEISNILVNLSIAYEYEKPIYYIYNEKEKWLLPDFIIEKLVIEYSGVAWDKYWEKMRYKLSILKRDFNIIVVSNKRNEKFIEKYKIPSYCLICYNFGMLVEWLRLWAPDPTDVGSNPTHPIIS